MGHGGKRDNAGRKSKADEQLLIERLTPLMPKAFEALKNALKSEEQWAVKLSFEYFYGKPHQTVDQNNRISISDFDITKLYKTSNKEME